MMSDIVKEITKQLRAVHTLDITDEYPWSGRWLGF